MMSDRCSPDNDVAGIGDIVAFTVACVISSLAGAFATLRTWYHRPQQRSPCLDDIVSALSTTQLIYGSAILSALYRRHQYGLTPSAIEDDPYYHLTVYMLLANTSSGFSCALGLGLNGDIFKARIRALFYLVIIIFYCVLLILGYSQHRLPNDEFCVSLVLTVLGVLSNMWNVYAWRKKKLQRRWVIFNVAIQVVATLIGLVYTFLLRWNVYGEQVGGCNLNSPANNHLSYGQVIAIALTLAILVQVFDAFYDNIEDDLAKSVLKWLRCYDWLKRQKQPIEPATDVGGTNTVELSTT